NNIPVLVGDIFICPEQADRQAKNFGNSFDKEIALLLIHGLLHLIGFDDITLQDQKIMRSAEKEMLELAYKNRG
ncbi:MAG: rRNA maturation RNase YbeY, partial [Elusimicrobiota bacterium]|nr:rRNA maturation RNase YbeY [Elusimicrobiota bacterium]